MPVNNPPSATPGNLDLPSPLTNAQQSLMLDEAIATWTATNRLREMCVSQIGKLIIEGKDPTALMDFLSKACGPDEFTKQVLAKLL